MKDQLLYLQQLQDIDVKTQEIRQSILAVPAQLDPAKKDLAMLEGMLETERSQLAETESWRAEQEEIVTRDEEALKNAKAKLQEAKNARDFGAASREIDNKKRAIHDREQEILKVYEALEVGKAKLEAHETDVAKLRAHVESEQAKFSDVLTELESRAVAAVAGREAIVVKINADLLKRYDTVIQRRGNAVVAVKGGVCQGCHMALAPQLAIQVERAESIHACRQCKRLLYIPETSDNEAEAAS